MKPAVIISILLILLSLFAVDIHFSSSYDEYSSYNSNWNGTSLFVSDALANGAVLVEDYEVLSSAKNSTLIIIEPEDNFSPDELRILREFKNNGNIVFISEKSGLSKNLFKVLGTDISVLKIDLMSVDREFDNPGFIIAYVNKNDTLTTGVKSIVLNRPSSAQGGDVLISTSILSWIDENKNKRADFDEPFGKRGVFVKSENTYLLSDSGIFLNSLYKDEKLKDNKRFISNLLKSSDKIYLENSHSKIALEDGILKYLNIMRKNDFIKTGAATTIIFLLVLFVFRGKNDQQ
ncbi:DUF4350 domain-containing protein [Methanomicrobium antiquum]|uniref:DUF4350 domain-containing protein n=1 Tax=Methanomicrobium antiquum TaxID=487686 RepID=A0AAF0FZI7_9EURY|nr:DUF4350 domain-containing protein [Methanomicrobium antiquum]WFN37354.1 DUF4350 domain-containing protein [Methanomicrobium antiquum]